MWKKFSQTQTYKIWTGFAFENICLKHISQIKRAMGIGGIYSETSTYLIKGNETQKHETFCVPVSRSQQVIVC